VELSVGRGFSNNGDRHDAFYGFLWHFIETMIIKYHQFVSLVPSHQAEAGSST
jgi:hypothetical protein